MGNLNFEKDGLYAIYHGRAMRLARVRELNGCCITIDVKGLIDGKCFEHHGVIKRLVTGAEVEGVVRIEHFAIWKKREYQFFYNGGETIQLWVTNTEKDKEICDTYGRHMLAPGEYYVLVPLKDVEFCQKNTYYDKMKYIDHNKAVEIKVENC